MNYTSHAIALNGLIIESRLKWPISSIGIDKEMRPPNKGNMVFITSFLAVYHKLT